jgi:MFS family permease
MVDKFSNHIKNILHGFFLALGTTVAEPATILPLIINYFGGSSLVVGFFASLLRGGAIVVQLFAAFGAQSKKLMMPSLRWIFFVRFFSWFLIGVAILLFGKESPHLTLWLIGIGLFVFSFSAGFAAIYFREVMGKIFSHKFRGKSVAYRQFFSGAGGLLSGLVAGFILHAWSAPQSYGYLFLVSSVFMAFGYIAFGLVEEPIKEEVSQKESKFREFLKNSWQTLMDDGRLRLQTVMFLLSYGYLLAMPFIVLDAKSKVELTAAALGLLITAQMVGAMFSNILWGALSSRGKNLAVVKLSVLMQISALLLAVFASSLELYLLIFFIFGASIDGNRIASANMILEIAPPAKRAVYVALQMNIVSFGMFFSMIGGFIVHYFSYLTLYSTAIAVLLGAFALSFRR